MSFDLHRESLRNQGYEPLSLLGQGSFSSVYTVEDLKSKRLKAVKIIENQLASFSADETHQPTELSDTSRAKRKRSIEDRRRRKMREHKAGQKYFNREILTLKRLIQGYHPHIVKIFAIKRNFLYTYIFMEHLTKGNLNDYLNQSGPLEPDDRLAKLWVYQLGSALEYLHSIGIAHRDVKLQNIGLTEQMSVKLIDFGFACRCVINRTGHLAGRSAEMRNNNEIPNEPLKGPLPMVSCRSADSILPNEKHLHNLGDLSKQSSQLGSANSRPEQIVQFSMSQCGTPLFIAPEVIIADKCPYDPRKADVWSLGVTMFAIISYRYPFTKRDYKILYRQQLRRSWQSKRVYTCFSVDAFDLIQCMLEPMPKKRYTASQVLQHRWIRSAEQTDDCGSEGSSGQKVCDLKQPNNCEEGMNKQMKQLSLVGGKTTGSSESERSSESGFVLSDESVNVPISKSILSTRTGVDSQSCI